MQMHIFDLHADSEGISRNIARFTALGVQVHITEMDVAVPLNAAGQASTSDLAQQANVYREIASACLAHPGCTAIQTWGFTDKYSWIGWKTRGAKGKACHLTATTSPSLGMQRWRRLPPSAARSTRIHPIVRTRIPSSYNCVLAPPGWLAGG